jgi:hypothetical protein
VPDEHARGLEPIVTEHRRLKSSFIYLANAVNDLRGNWGVIGLALAPLVTVAALCLLPDAINLQFELATRFGASIHNVFFSPVQAPYPSSVAHPPVGPWTITVLHIASGLITLMVNLVVMCTLERIRSEVSGGSKTDEAIAIYRRVLALTPSFLWVVLLQFVAVAVGVMMILLPFALLFLWIVLMHYAFVIDVRLLIIPAGFVLVWVYFAQYALVFDRMTSWHALLFSRDLVRGRYFRVALRILVFFAVWSGFNSWAGGAFVLASLVIGPVAALTDTVSIVIFVLDFLTVAVAFTTIAFFIAAAARLYRDLSESTLTNEAVGHNAAAIAGTAPLSTTSVEQQA